MATADAEKNISLLSYSVQGKKEERKIKNDN